MGGQTEVVAVDQDPKVAASPIDETALTLQNASSVGRTATGPATVRTATVDDLVGPAAAVVVVAVVAEVVGAVALRLEVGYRCSTQD